MADRREDNGGPVVDDSILLELRAIVAQSPHAFGWPRATWTQEMLALTLARCTGVRLSRQTIGRGLRAIGARHGRSAQTQRAVHRSGAARSAAASRR